MKNIPNISFAMACCASLVFSCSQSTAFTGDADEESDAEEIQDVTGDESPIPVVPLTFVVLNETSETVYLDWQWSGNNVVEGGRKITGDWDFILYWPPSCIAGCDEVAFGEECCIDCAPEPSVRELEAGEEVEFEWDGENVYVLDHHHCSCACYRAAAVTPMAYMAKACVNSTFVCYDEPCEADDDGIIRGASIVGEAWCFDRDFGLPFSVPMDGRIIIEVD